jgi:ankyrin repeat protein
MKNVNNSIMKTWIATLFTAGTLAWSNLAPGGEIHTAAMRGDVEKVKALLAADPDLVSSQDEHGWTPLYFAAASGHKDVVELLIANKADVNALNQNFTPLRAAAMNGHPDVAELLIASNAQVTIFDAAAGGYLEIVKSQLKADPALVSATDNSGWTALQFAARNGHLDVVKLLLANKADVNARGRTGMAPLATTLAFSGGAGSDATNHEAIAKLLIANGATVTNQRSGGITALHYAASAGLTNVVQELLAHHADVNARDGSGRTPVDFAAQRGRLNVVDLLVAGGAKMSAEDKAGLAALKDSEKGVQTRPSSPGREYEVDGKLNQTITENNGVTSHSSATFTVFVRDCGWLIATTENYEEGNDIVREIGSTNGTEIYQCAGITALVQSNTAPIGWLDREVAAHLWLMFASPCYWPSLNSDQLIPVYDWRASAGAATTGFANRQKKSADWELLNGPGSLPREVRYLDSLNHTNAIYTITGTNSTGGMLFPAGFVFKQFNGDRLEKRVEVGVTAIRPVCSRANLIPLPSKGITVIDARIDSGVPNRPSSYQNPLFGQWLSAEEAKKLAGINTSNTLRNLARVGISAFPETRSPFRETNTALPVLSLSIRCTNDVVKVGDEIAIEFRITNRGTNDYRYPNRNYDRSGRMPEYHLVATNSSGVAVSNVFKVGGFGGGGFQYATLKPGESFTKLIFLNSWALIKDPGRYVVAGTYHAEVVSNNPAVTSGTFITSIPIASAPIAVNVLPRTKAEMDAYISDLINQIASLTPKQMFPYGPYSPGSTGPTPELDELLEKLAYTCNPKIVPTMLDTMYLPGHGGFWESEAILAYVPRSDEIRKALIETAAKHGLGPNGTISYFLRDYGCTKEEMKPIIERALAPDNEQEWAAGAGLAQRFGDDAFTERLVTIAKTPRNNAQTAAIDALAYNRTDEGVKALKELFSDPHESIWTALAFAIQNAYNFRRDTMGRPLRPDDFTAADLKPLIQHLMSSDNQVSDVDTAIGLIGQFGGDEYTAQLIAIATSPGNFARDTAIYALALNRTDEGVNTLKTLLNDPDPKIRTTAEQSIRNAYTSRGNSRGRPLLPEDFDKQYQQPKTEK